MSPDTLQAAAFAAYIGAWLTFLAGAIHGALPSTRRRATPAIPATTAAAIGTMIQVASALVLAIAMPNVHLRPPPLQLGAVIILAPFAAAVFIWSIRSAPTTGAYAFLRYPNYLAFLAMLLATGLLVTGIPKLALAVVIYLVGTELRIKAEERTLATPNRSRTRWRYLPGLR